MRLFDDVGNPQLHHAFLPNRDVLVLVDQMLQQRARDRRCLHRRRSGHRCVAAMCRAFYGRARNQTELQAVGAQRRHRIRLELHRLVEVKLGTIQPCAIGTLVYQEPALAVFLQHGMHARKSRVF